MSTRFVILHHQAPGGEHWDLMLEHGDRLLTWQLRSEPVARTSLPMTARRIGDHRKAYLDYEGPISGDRGYVRRVDAGTTEFEEVTPDRYVVLLRGQRLSGRFTLTARGDEWVFAVADGA